MNSYRGVDQKTARELWEYRDGHLYWRESGRGRDIDKPAGGPSAPNGQWQLRIDGRMSLLHKLVYLYHHGTVPRYIRHINGDLLDNRIENLEPMDPNTPKGGKGRGRSGRKNSTGYRGVCKYFRDGKTRYVAQIRNGYKTEHILETLDVVAAAKAWDRRAMELGYDKSLLNFPEQWEGSDE